MKEKRPLKEIVLSAENATRMSAVLCEMRGAPLKLV